MNIDDLRQNLGELVKQYRDELDAMEKREDGLDKEKIAKMDKAIDDLEARIAAEDRQQNREKEMAKMVSLDKKSEERKEDKGTEYGDSFRRFLIGGKESLSGQEFRAMQAANNVTGGYLVAPQEFAQGLLKAVDNATVIRQMATVIQIPKAESLGVLSLDTDPSDSTWTSELATGGESSDMEFGKRELKPNPLAKRIKLSNKLIRSTVLNIEQLVQERLAYKAGVTLEAAFMTGTGMTSPLGLFTASNDGISTGRDVSTGNTDSLIKPDGLIEAKHTLKGQYWANAKWLLHRDGIKKLRKEKDGNGQYIWSPGITGGVPAMILDTPYVMSEYVPNTWTTGLYVGLIGDLKYYYIAEALGMQMQVLSELYAETNQTGYILRLEVDAMPVLEEAFVRVKLA